MKTFLIIMLIFWCSAVVLKYSDEQNLLLAKIFKEQRDSKE